MIRGGYIYKFHEKPKYVYLVKRGIVGLYKYLDVKEIKSN